MTDSKGYQRRLEIHRRLRGGQPVIATKLAREWSCSERTIRRDLEHMRDIDHLPMEFDPLDKTWRYTAKVAEIPPILVSAADRQSLLFALQAAAEFDDTPVAGAVRRLYQTFLNTLPPENLTSFQQLMQCIRFTGPRTPPISFEVWDAVVCCLEARETMHITYTDGQYGSTTERDIDPYGLLMRDRHWLLVAHCHWAEETRIFALHRIEQAQSTQSTFRMPERFMDRYLADSFDGMQSTGPKHRVKLRIPGDASPYLQKRIWSENETRTQSDDGAVIVEFTTSALFAVEREILAEAGRVELLEPADTRKRLRDMAQSLLDRHR